MRMLSLNAVALLVLGTCAGVALVAGGSPEKGLVAETRPETPIISSTPLSVQVRPPAALQAEIERVANGASDATIRLTVAGVKSQAPGVGVRVFLNLAGGGDVESAKSPHFVGTFSFFGASDQAEKGDYSFDLGPALRRLRQADKLDPTKPLTVALEATGLRPGQDVAAVKIPFTKVVIKAVKPSDPNR